MKSETSNSIPCSDAITWHGNAATFRGFPVEQREVQVAGMSLQIASMRDATHLLDEPDCAKRFLDADMAPYGVELWPAALMLAEYIARHDRGRCRALEIGCGLGLVSIMAAKLGWAIKAGDHEPSALVFARHNAQLNHVDSIDFAEFDWNHPPENARFDRILGADILYQLNNHAPVLRCIDRLLSADGMALISDPNRGVADRFLETARASLFHVELTHMATELPEGRSVKGRIFCIYRPQNAQKTILLASSQG